MGDYYPNYDESTFNNILNKYEFNEQEKREFIYQDPRQLLLRNLISKNTIYDNILLYWATGTGKTAAAITIAEGFKEYVINMNRKILVLVKNGNIEKNFRNELLSNVTKNAYKSEEGVISIESMNKINRKINKVYEFMTYGTFVNQVLGIKQYKVIGKDENGKDIKKIIKNSDGSIYRKRANNPIKKLNNTVIIIDEAHNVTNNDVYIALSNVLSVSYNYRLVLLTATPMYDNPKEIIEISNLLNMNNPNNILPIRNDLFKPYNGKQSLMTKETSTYLSSSILKSGLTHISDLGIEQLKRTLLGKVSHLQANLQTFPSKIDNGTPLFDRIGSIKVIYCNMNIYQYNVYKKALERDSKENNLKDNTLKETETIELDYNLDTEDNPLSSAITTQSSSLYKNSSDASTMTYPNNLFGKEGFTQCINENTHLIKDEFKDVFKLKGQLKKYSTKLANLLNNINKSDGTVFIYSNYVNYGGTSLIKHVLLQNGYVQYTSSQSDSTYYKSFILYDDSTSIDTRESQRVTFNSTKNKDGKYIKIIIGSPIISEGITLKNVRQVHILEPSWNMSRINQIIGRAIRHHSHDDLQENKRNVEIYKYCSIYTEEDTIPFIDKEKYILVEEKDRANKKIERLLKEIAFDCNINTNIISSSAQNGTAECDYVECKYKCLLNPLNKELNKFTYNLYINFFDEFDLEICMVFIKDIFKQYFIWSIPDIINKIKKLQSMISTESIYTTLKHLITNKTILLDQFGREGFLIQKSDYIIFNPLDVDINSSIYSKMLDFNVDNNKYDINQYSKLKLNKDLTEETEDITEEKQKTKTPDKQITLTKQQLAFNNELIENKKVYGSYRERPTKNSPELFGPIDNKFRIIDKRNIDIDQLDQRKNISGMACKSYDKDHLKSIIQYLNMTNDEIKQYLEFVSNNNIQINNLNIKQLCQIIEKHMHKYNLILQ